MRTGRQPLLDGAFFRLTVEQSFSGLAPVAIDLFGFHLPLLCNFRSQLVVVVAGRNVCVALVAFDATVTEHSILIVGQSDRL
jgi:hypothetical protein